LSGFSLNWAVSRWFQTHKAERFADIFHGDMKYEFCASNAITQKGNSKVPYNIETAVVH
jgi:hypothetical protein